MRAEQEQAIRERAYAIWEQEGHPEGKALDHWLLAEAFNATEPEPPTPSPAPRGIPLWDRALRWWRQADHQRRTANATALLASGTILLAMFSLLTLFVTHCDTTRLIEDPRVASTQQHNDTLAALTKTTDVVSETHALADAAQKTANAAIQANQLTLNTFVAGQRPWVLYDDARPTSPLVIGDDRLSLEFTLLVKNYGHSPAREVALIAKMIDFGFKNQIPYVERRKLCEPERGFAKQITGRTLAASDMTIPLSTIVGFSADEFRKIINSTANKLLMPVIIGCIDYQSIFDNIHHQTPFELEVYKVNRNNPSESLFTIESSQTSIPAEELRFRRSPLLMDAPD
jgi:hypothetical protein